MMLQDPPISETPLHSSLLNVLKQDKVMEGAIARAVSDRIFEQAQEIGEAARQQMETVDWTSEILRAVEDKGVSEELTKSFGGFGDSVALRIQIAIVEYADRLSEIKQDAQDLLKVEEETKKVSLEKRWEIRRNAQLTRIEWSLSIFSLWPVLALICFSMFIGAASGIYMCQKSATCAGLHSSK